MRGDCFDPRPSMQVPPMSDTPSPTVDDDLNRLIDELQDDDPAVRLAVARDLRAYGERAV